LVKKTLIKHCAYLLYLLIFIKHKTQQSFVTLLNNKFIIFNRLLKFNKPLNQNLSNPIYY